jgi:hypothetical protein
MLVIKMTPQELLSLIQGDTEASAHFIEGNDFACAQRCVAIAAQIQNPVPHGELLQVMALNGSWAAIELARANPQVPDQIKGICITLIRWIDEKYRLDFSLPAVQQMIGGLVQAAVISQEQADQAVATSWGPQVITADGVSAVRSI